VSSFLSNERQAVIGQRERLLLPPLTHGRAQESVKRLRIGASDNNPLTSDRVEIV